MLPGTEIGAALCALEAMDVDVIGLNCATGPAEMFEPLRHLTGHALLPVSCLPNAGLPSVVDGKMHYDLSPDQLADFHRQFVSELGVSVIGGCCGTTPAHLAAVVEACADLTPATRDPEPELGAASIYTQVPFHQDTSFLVIGERTNANGSKKFREAMLSGDWDTCVAMAREQVKEGSHLIDVCVDYTGADGVADMEEVASRFATQSTAPWWWTRPRHPWSRPLSPGSVDGRSSTRSTSKKATMKAPVSTPSSHWPRSSARPSCAPASTPRDRPAPRNGRSVLPRRSTTSRSSATGSAERPALRSSGASALDRDGGEPARRHRDHRRHPPDQGGAPGRVHGPRALQRLLRSQSRSAPGAQLGLPPRMRRSRARRGDRPRVEDPPPLEDRRADPRSLSRPRLRPSPRRLRPADRAPRPLRGRVQLLCGGRRGPVGMAGRAAPRAPDRRRGPQRARRGPRRSDDRRHGAARHHQRRAALGHEDGRRPVRLGRDAASVRARLRRDHEACRLAPRALHGEGRSGRQGGHRARHRQGRRARHREEPGRHHPDQQRVHGEEPRDQGRDHRDDHRARGRRGGRDRYERSAGQVDTDHARQLGGAQPTRPRATCR